MRLVGYENFEVRGLGLGARGERQEASGERLVVRGDQRLCEWDKRHAKCCCRCEVVDFFEGRFLLCLQN